MNPLLFAVLTDQRLSAESRVCCLYIAEHGDEWNEIERDDFRRLLGGAGRERVANALGELELWGYVERKPGGRGHSDSFKFSGGESRPLKDSVSKTPPLKSDSDGKTPPLNAPSTTPTSTTTEPPIVPLSEVREVVDYLGEEPVRLALDSGFIEPIQLRGILSMFGPSGTQAHRLFGRAPPEERVEALTTAIVRFAMDGKKYNNRLFEAYLQRARDGDFGSGRTGDSTGSGNGHGAERNGRTPSEARAAQAGARGQVWIEE